MPLFLQPLEPEDLTVYFEVVYDALSENGLWEVIFPNGYTPEDRELYAKNILNAWQAAPDRNFLMKAIDTSLPTDQQILGISRWILYRNGEDLENEVKTALDSSSRSTITPSMDAEMRQAFIEMVARAKLEHMSGQAFFYLQLLAVRRKAQGKGVGSLHLKWGTAKADELDLTLYVESSPVAVKVYEKYGFGRFRDISLGGKWEGDGRAGLILMRRSAGVPAQ